MEEFLLKNPFVCFLPVRGDDFFNREKIIKEIETICIYAKAQGDVWIAGERQVGKTSLFLELVRRINSSDIYTSIYAYNKTEDFRIYPLYISCQAIKDDKELYINLIKSLSDEFDYKISKEKTAFENFKDCLIHIHLQKYYIIFLLDEFDAFLEKFCKNSIEGTNNFIDNLNTIKNTFPVKQNLIKIFSMVFASNYGFKEIFNVLDIKGHGSGLQSIVEKELTWFTFDQIKKLIKLYLRDNKKVEFTEKEIEYCYKMTKGYPLFTQKLLYILYEEKLNSQNDIMIIKNKAIKKQFVEDFQKIIKNWEAQTKLSTKALSNLKKISIVLLKEIKDAGIKIATDSLVQLSQGKI